MSSKSKFASGAREHAARLIRDGIWVRRWEAGQTLDAVALATELGISPSPVREALSRLRGEGIVHSKHRGGYSIPLLHPHEVTAEYEFVGIVAGGLAARGKGTRRLEPHRELESAPLEHADRWRLTLIAIATAADMPPAVSALTRSCLRLRHHLEAEASVVQGADARVREMLMLSQRGSSVELAELMKCHSAACAAAAPDICRRVFDQSKIFEKSFE